MGNRTSHNPLKFETGSVRKNIALLPQKKNSALWIHFRETNIVVKYENDSRTYAMRVNYTFVERESDLSTGHTTIDSVMDVLSNRGKVLGQTWVSTGL